MLDLSKSQSLYEQAKLCIAGGVTSSMRLNAKPMMFFDRAEGPYIWDVDGNKYIDYRMGAGPLILGHTPQSVIEATTRQLYGGFHTSSDTPGAVEAATRLVELVPCAELLRFANTGSEAVQLALRLARAHRNRRKIIQFESHYHGWFDNVWAKASTVSENPDPATEGQGNGLEDTIILPWNDIESVKSAIAARANEIAAIITAPIHCATKPTTTMPRPGFLEGLRELCSENDIVLIFDEIITGFRVALGGAQELFGVQPDLATYAKALAAGMTIGAVAGKRELMDYITTGRVLHPGTYNGNSMTMAAVIATMDEFTKDDGVFYCRCDAMRKRLGEGLLDAARRRGVDLHVTGAGALLGVRFASNPDPYEYRAERAGFDSGRATRFFDGLMARGVLASDMMFLTAAHTDAEIDKTIEAAEAAMAEV
jgi:glutamate-1-semialdehyde 2,1-aminomutase